MSTQQFQVLNEIPKAALPGMHPETKRIIDELKRTRGKVLACTLKTPRDAKRRADALRRARKRGTVSFKDVVRRGPVIYVRRG